MSPTRIDMLLGFLQQKPSDPFPRYALALEYKNAGRLPEARTEFDRLLGEHADYTAGYLHAGNLYVALGLASEAGAIYRRGIEACIRRADTHARGELEGALAALPAA